MSTEVLHLDAAWRTSGGILDPRFGFSIVLLGKFVASVAEPPREYTATVLGQTSRRLRSN